MFLGMVRQNMPGVADGCYFLVGPPQMGNTLWLFNSAMDNYHCLKVNHHVCRV
jgi:hypothetical protein